VVHTKALIKREAMVPRIPVLSRHAGEILVLFSRSSRVIPVFSSLSNGGNIISFRSCPLEEKTGGTRDERYRSKLGRLRG
jgi:hypothetical protein